MTAAGRGEHVQLAYPIEVTRAVSDSWQAALPDTRALILTRSAFLGQQRYPAFAGRVQPAQNMQQRGFTAAGSAHNTHAFPCGYLKVEIGQHGHVQLAVYIAFAHILALQYPITHNARPPPVGFWPHASWDRALPKKTITKKYPQ